MSKRFLFVTTAVVTATLSSMSLAGEMKLTDLDANKDGKVTLVEWEAAHKGKKDAMKFADLDADKNGNLTAKEYEAAMMKMKK
ncbi:MAG: hypothetical protein ACR2OW_14440 [Methyloligellaceae bacterium]